jgi:23S rRNA maturation mini-RNase III
MSFATFTNIIVIFIGAAVLVQSVRMMRSFRAVKDGGLKQMVEALDKATGQARLVLADLKDTLRTEGAANARARRPRRDDPGRARGNGRHRQCGPPNA